MCYWAWFCGSPAEPAEAPTLRIRLSGHVRFPVFETLLSAFHGCDNRKNWFPVGGVMVMLFVPLAVLME